MPVIIARGGTAVDWSDDLARAGRAATRAPSDAAGGRDSPRRRVRRRQRFGGSPTRYAPLLRRYGAATRVGAARGAGSTGEPLRADHGPMLVVAIQHRPGQVDVRGPGCWCWTCAHFVGESFMRGAHIVCRCESLRLVEARPRGGCALRMREPREH